MSSPRTVSSTELRARFAARLSNLYGAEVPAYKTLVEVSQAVNERVIARDGAAAERLGSIDRVTAERHGAIRVGTPRELAQVSRVFGALGMSPCGFYDLRDAAPAPVPVVSTAFRPLDRAELAANPFRVFTSMLVPEDRRFFDPDLAGRLQSFLAARELFPAELLDLADVAIEHGELSATDADRFLELAAASFALSAEPVDRAWYSELERISGVAADIGGVTTTHINHLTPRVLDIDDLYESMQARGIEMISEIQGPPRWDGPDVLLRQTSFRALSEPRTFRDADGGVSTGALRVRFGEVEARGVALTPAGRDRFDELVAEVDRRLADNPDLRRADVAPRGVEARDSPPPSATCASPVSASSRSMSNRAWLPGVRRRSRRPRWSAGRSTRSSRPASCTPSRSSTRTSCPVRLPASSPRTWRTAEPWTRTRAEPGVTPTGWRTPWGERSTSRRSSTRRRHQPHSVRPRWPSVERSAPRGLRLDPGRLSPG